MPPRRIAHRAFGVRIDHALIAAGSAVMVVASFMPWIRGSTRMQGEVDWTGLHDTGEGAMLIFGAVFLALWIRLRGTLFEIEPRSRLAPLVIVLASGLLWIAATRKIYALSWFELAVGARPQPGLWLAGIGIVIALAGALPAAMDREHPDGEGPEEPGSGAGGGVGAASRSVRRGGESPPIRDDYSVAERVKRVSPGVDDAHDGGPARG